MRFLLSFLTVFCATTLSLIHEGRASGGSPSPFFDAPSYIDPDYKVPGYAEFEYGQKAKFNTLLYLYNSSQQTTNTNVDIKARVSSKKNETALYNQYATGADRFDAGSYAAALTIFADLANRRPTLMEQIDGLIGKPSSSWAKEASTYMVARCQLTLAQDGWDGYSDPLKNVDQILLHQADLSYQRYLKEFPDGLYARSARNIRRKIFFLSGNQTELSIALRQLLGADFPSGDIKPGYGGTTGDPWDDVSEFERYFHGAIDIAHDSPLLVGYAWFADQAPTAANVVTLEQREKDFRPYPGLFRYVRALGLYRTGQYQRLLDKTPQEALAKNTLSLAIQVLRARAFAQVGKSDAAAAALRDMQAISPEDSVGLELVFLKLNLGQGLSLFAGSSPLANEKVLRSAAQYGLTDDELEQGISRHDITGNPRRFLVEELARRYMLLRQFGKLSVLLSGQRDGSADFFTPVQSDAATLSGHPGDPQALVEVGEFLDTHYLTPQSTFENYDENYYRGDPLEDLLPRCKPCSAFKDRSRAYAPPFVFFQAVAQSMQRAHVKGEAEAEALHYIVGCLRPFGEMHNRCIWNDSDSKAPGIAGKEAFIRLHKVYKTSPWTAKTPYYY